MAWESAQCWLLFSPAFDNPRLPCSPGKARSWPTSFSARAQTSPRTLSPVKTLVVKLHHGKCSALHLGSKTTFSLSTGSILWDPAPRHPLLCPNAHPLLVVWTVISEQLGGRDHPDLHVPAVRTGDARSRSLSECVFGGIHVLSAVGTEAELLWFTEPAVPPALTPAVDRQAPEPTLPLTQKQSCRRQLSGH